MIKLAYYSRETALALQAKGATPIYSQGFFSNREHP